MCIAGHDRAGIERLLRYWARPSFALERIEQISEQQVVDRLPKPRRDGRAALSFTPLELIDRLAAILPPPRLHRHCYHGALTPNSPLRVAGTSSGRDLTLSGEPPPSKTAASPAAAAPGPGYRSPAHYLWAMLIARLFLALPLVCPHCGGDRHIVAVITGAAPVRRILKHVGEPAEPPPTPWMEEVEPRLEQRPRITPARGPPAWDDPPVDLGPDWEALAQPQPECAFAQPMQW